MQVMDWRLRITYTNGDIRRIVFLGAYAEAYSFACDIADGDQTVANVEIF